MVQKSYTSELRSKGYAKAYSKRVKSLLNAKFMHLLLMPKDIKSIRVIAYEKKSKDEVLTSTCILQFVNLISGVKLRYMSFMLSNKVTIDDQHMRNEIGKMLSEQDDLQERLDEYGFIKL